MRYRCIDRRRLDYPIAMMCRVLRVSRSGYYAWCTRPESARAKTDRELIRVIQRLHAQSNGVYGSPKMLDDHPKAAKVLDNMNLTNNMQASMIYDIDVKKLDSEDVVDEWMEANQSVWRKWLP